MGWGRVSGVKYQRSPHRIATMRQSKKPSPGSATRYSEPRGRAGEESASFQARGRADNVDTRYPESFLEVRKPADVVQDGITHDQPGPGIPDYVGGTKDRIRPAWLRRPLLRLFLHRYRVDHTPNFSPV